MSKGELDLLAAEYVLGTLDSARRRLVSRQQMRDEALREQVEAWDRRLSALNDSAGVIPPPPALWPRIEGAVDAEPSLRQSALTVRASEAAWERLAPGIERKVLYVDPHAGWQSYLLRMAPGASLAGHGHDKIEECLLLEGELMIGDLRLGAGDYHLAHAGTLHPEISSENGAVAFIRGELAQA